jgi:GNAT superfamily N-acetyltransferase
MKKQIHAPALKIRQAAKRDVPAILSLIRGIAEYEKLTHQVRTTPAQLRKHGFGPRAYFHTLICSRGPKIVGFAMYFFTYSSFLARPTLYIEDIFVVPEERRKGAGKALLARLAKIAVKRDCGRMEWAVLDWTRPAIRFSEQIGARLMKEWILTRLETPQIRNLAKRGVA